METNNWYDDAPRVVVKETLLSKKPAPHSFAVSAVSVLVLVAASIVYWTDAFGLAELLPASREAVFHRGEYWRLATSVAVHADFQHLLTNSIVFAVLSFLLFGYYGAWVYPGLALGLGTLVTALSLRTYEAHVNLLGASGVVYLMAAFWLVLYLVVERRTPLKMRIVRAAGFGLIVLVPTAVEPSISYRTHVIGFVVGAVAAILYFSRNKEAIRAHERVELD